MNVINSAVGQKGIVMKVKISYSINGQKLSFEEKIDKFPASMWFLLIVLSLFSIYIFIQSLYSLSLYLFLIVKIGKKDKSSGLKYLYFIIFILEGAKMKN